MEEGVIAMGRKKLVQLEAMHKGPDKETAGCASTLRAGCSAYKLRSLMGLPAR